MYAADQSVAKMRDAHLFIQTRARLQRLSDMKFFSGWIQEISHVETVVRFKKPAAPIERGDEFSVEVAGKEQTAVLIASVKDIQGDIARLDVKRGPALLPKKEAARVSMFGYPGKVQFEGSEFMFTLVDVSESGLGVMMAADVPKDSEIDFEVTTPLGSVVGKGLVKYCRADDDSPDRKRVGIQLTQFDRIERARWNQLLHYSQDA